MTVLTALQIEHSTWTPFELHPEENAYAQPIQLFLAAYQEQIKPLCADQKQLQFLTEDLVNLLRSSTEHAELVYEQPELAPIVPDEVVAGGCCLQRLFGVSLAE